MENPRNLADFLDGHPSANGVGAPDFASARNPCKVFICRREENGSEGLLIRVANPLKIFEG
ncbi:hypothetical protein HD598_001390 [Neomicrococcus aestuarii]|jgi:hypothetical protein|uniref:Uncharacterized protein n=1 Tax=Neomicrococcus aestuarii TaxID=556325 RepID=A0A7W8X0B2_9MICC|nr:hypothetical protein [Neomicrococcus aestuarii]